MENRKCTFLRAIIALTLGGALLAGVFTDTSKASEIEFVSEVEFSHSTNILQTPAPVPDKLLKYLISGRYIQNVPALNANILASLELLDYVDNVESDNYIPRIDATSTWILSRDRMSWILEDRMEEIRSDPLLNISSANQELYNIFRTGPDFQLRITPVDTAIIEGRYINSYFRTNTNQNNNIYEGAMRLVHRLSPGNNVTANLEGSHIAYIEKLIPDPLTDYRHYNAFLGYERLRRYGNMQVNLGKTRIYLDTGEVYGGTIFNISFNRRPNTTSEWSVAAEANYSNITDNILDTEVLEDPRTRNEGVYYNQELRGSYSTQQGYGNYRISGYARDQDFVDSPSHIRAYGADILFVLVLNPRTTTEITAIYDKTRTIDLGQLDQEYEIGAQVIYQLQRELFGTVGILTRGRVSTDPAQGFIENVFSISVEFRRRTIRR